MCHSYGFKGLYPLDNEIEFTSKRETAKKIYEANVKLIKEADIVIANLNDFRGKEADSGTVWECGFATALQKDVYAYMDNTNTYLNRFNNSEKQLDIDMNVYTDNDHKIIEDFDLPINLMLGCSIKKIIQGDFEDVLKEISK